MVRAVSRCARAELSWALGRLLLLTRAGQLCGRGDAALFRVEDLLVCLLHLALGHGLLALGGRVLLHGFGGLLRGLQEVLLDAREILLGGVAAWAAPARQTGGRREVQRRIIDLSQRGARQQAALAELVAGGTKLSCGRRRQRLGQIDRPVGEFELVFREADGAVGVEHVEYGGVELRDAQVDERQRPLDGAERADRVARSHPGGTPGRKRHCEDRRNGARPREVIPSSHVASPTGRAPASAVVPHGGTPVKTRRDGFRAAGADPAKQMRDRSRRGPPRGLVRTRSGSSR